jgi:hypothetical protein
MNTVKDDTKFIKMMYFYYNITYKAFTASDCNFGEEDEDYLFITKKEISFDKPDKNILTDRIIEKLKKSKEIIQAETFIRLKEIDEHIATLLCLENKG